MDPLTLMAAISAISAASSIVMNQQAADEQEEAQEMQTAQEEIRQRNEQAKQLREARGARARAEQSAANTGTSGSSAEAGTVSSVQTQMAGNLAFLQGEANTANNVTARMGKSQDKSMVGQDIQAVGSLFATFAGKGLFSKQPKPTDTYVRAQTVVNPPQ